MKEEGRIWKVIKVIITRAMFKHATTTTTENRKFSHTKEKLFDT